MTKTYFTLEEAKTILSLDTNTLETKTRRLLVAKLRWACREIVFLNNKLEKRKKQIADYKSVFCKYGDDDYGGNCDKCGGKLQIVRPGKWQCPECE